MNAAVEARFSVGQLVHHKLLGYRGVVVDVDPCFQGSDEWYEDTARSQPPKDKPWYHVLVHEADYETYVAEKNLEPDESQQPVNHPDLLKFFDDFEGGLYVKHQRLS
jgi:heat shock protein HspQ